MASTTAVVSAALLAVVLLLDTSRIAWCSATGGAASGEASHTAGSERAATTAHTAQAVGGGVASAHPLVAAATRQSAQPAATEARPTMETIPHTDEATINEHSLLAEPSEPATVGATTMAQPEVAASSEQAGCSNCQPGGQEIHVPREVYFNRDTAFGGRRLMMKGFRIL